MTEDQQSESVPTSRFIMAWIIAFGGMLLLALLVIGALIAGGVLP